ncbi:hypothetical protein M513_02243 [Trichuris suis]|uniref:Uncharacterized protein n=1 Tax=Trichuris suis TaxID=68888 RepID=A0A085MIE0_9BILA|nr:hypothetical protein M513_02243 [Trichuris suis]
MYESLDSIRIHGPNLLNDTIVRMMLLVAISAHADDTFIKADRCDVVVDEEPKILRKGDEKFWDHSLQGHPRREFRNGAIRAQRIDSTIELVKKIY